MEETVARINKAAAEMNKEIQLPDLERLGEVAEKMTDNNEEK